MPFLLIIQHTTFIFMRILHFDKRLLLLRQIVNEFCRNTAYEKHKITHNVVILIDI